MRLTDHFPSAGDVLFRWRSYLPLVLLPLFAAGFIGAHYPHDSHTEGLTWEIGCWLVAMAGVALRIWTVGTAPAGTSGRNTRAQKAAVLNTTGPYSVLRHPLYAANYLIALGLACFPRAWAVPIIVSLAALLYYERIAAREEEYLEQKFGDAFRRWASITPALVPVLDRYRRPALPFRWRRALGREFHAIGLVSSAFFLLDVAEDLVVTGRLVIDPVWTTIGLAGLGTFVLGWTAKKLAWRRRALSRSIG